MNITPSSFVLSLLGCLVFFSASQLGLGEEEGKPTFGAKPWIAQGTVTDGEGQPIGGAEIIAHCGMGTLLPTGKAATDVAGKYELHFGPGVLFGSRFGETPLQAATISVHKPGFFEKNLHRQGDLLAGYKLPKGDLGWGKKRAEDVFLPNQPKTLHFVLLPAASLSGILRGSDGKPLAQTRIGLTGDELPPSSSVLQEVKTDPDGKFRFDNLPTGYRFRLYVDDHRSNWRKWPNLNVRFNKAAAYEASLELSNGRIRLQNGQEILDPVHEP